MGEPVEFYTFVFFGDPLAGGGFYGQQHIGVEFDGFADDAGKGGGVLCIVGM